MYLAFFIPDLVELRWYCKTKNISVSVILFYSNFPSRVWPPPIWRMCRARYRQYHTGQNTDDICEASHGRASRRRRFSQRLLVRCETPMCLCRILRLQMPPLEKLELSLSHAASCTLPLLLHTRGVPRGGTSRCSTARARYD